MMVQGTSTIRLPPFGGEHFYIYVVPRTTWPWKQGFKMADPEAKHLGLPISF